MKLPYRRRKPASEILELASTTPDLRVLIFSNTDLPEQEFKAQLEKLRRVADYDPALQRWHTQLPLDRPEWAAQMLTTLLEAARIHGTVIQVQARPADESGQPRQAP
jgi:hypothetical protein